MSRKFAASLALVPAICFGLGFGIAAESVLAGIVVAAGSYFTFWWVDEARRKDA